MMRPVGLFQLTIRISSDTMATHFDAQNAIPNTHRAIHKNANIHARPEAVNHVYERCETECSRDRLQHSSTIFHEVLFNYLNIKTLK
jgi:hypothetical protein